MIFFQAYLFAEHAFDSVAENGRSLLDLGHVRQLASFPPDEVVRVGPGRHHQVSLDDPQGQRGVTPVLVRHRDVLLRAGKHACDVTSVKIQKCVVNVFG